MGSSLHNEALLYIVVGEVIFSPIDEKNLIFLIVVCCTIQPLMHTNRYLVHTLKNNPALIRYQLRALTSLVGRHSGRESGFGG